MGAPDGSRAAPGPGTGEVEGADAAAAPDADPSILAALRARGIEPVHWSSGLERAVSADGRKYEIDPATGGIVDLTDGARVRP